MFHLAPTYFVATSGRSRATTYRCVSDAECRSGQRAESTEASPASAHRALGRAVNRAAAARRAHSAACVQG